MPRKRRPVLRLAWVRLANALSNALPDDGLSCRLRGQLLSSLGAQLGAGTVVRGGGYFNGGRITAGTNCFINRGCYLDFTGHIVFEDDVVVGHGVTFITAEHSIGPSHRRAGPTRGHAIKVQEGAWIGANAVVLPGVTIGRGAIIAAGSIVIADVAPDVVVAGVPAKQVKAL